jgi:hypothetical protein
MVRREGGGAGDGKNCAIRNIKYNGEQVQKKKRKSNVWQQICSTTHTKTQNTSAEDKFCDNQNDNKIANRFILAKLPGAVKALTSSDCIS